MERRDVEGVVSRDATPADVLAGAARFAVVEGDALDVVRALPASCIDALVTDPPSGIAFMGAEWDRDRGGRAQWVAWLAEVLGYARAATRDGGRALVWSLPRTSHWTGCAVEDAGWSIETTVTHLFGCLTPDTEVLVNGEWVSYDKATAGNLALCYDAERDSLAWQPISELVVYDHHQHLFRLVGDRTDQLVTRGHRVAVYRDGRVVFLPADEVAESGTAEVPVVEDVQSMLAALPLPQRAGGSLEGVRGGVPSDAAAVEAEEGEADLRDVRSRVHAEEQQAARFVPVLLGGVLREVARSEPGYHRAHARGGPEGQSGLDKRVEGVVPLEDDRPAQPCMEGRRHAGEFQGELPARRVRSLPAGVLCDGSPGRLDSRAQADDGAGHRSNAHDSGERASRQSQPAGQPTGEPDAVREQLGSQAVRASRFASPDLVRVEPARHDGIVWCVRVPTGAFVARRNGKVFITGNTGWPKGKSQLKPAAETWWLARTGRSTALNIEACRVGAQSTRRENRAPMGYMGNRAPMAEGYATGSDSGRWPPNVVLSHSPGCVLEGVRKVPCNNAPRNNAYAVANTYGSGIPRVVPVGFGDPDGTETVDAWRCVEPTTARVPLFVVGTTRPSGPSHEPELLPGLLRSALRDAFVCSTSDTSPLRGEGARGDIEGIRSIEVAPSPADAAARVLGLTELLGSLDDCQSCLRSCDERVRQVAAAFRESPLQLLGVLADVCSGLFALARNRPVQCHDRQSSSGDSQPSCDRKSTPQSSTPEASRALGSSGESSVRTAGMTSPAQPPAGAGGSSRPSKTACATDTSETCSCTGCIETHEILLTTWCLFVLCEAFPWSVSRQWIDIQFGGCPVRELDAQAGARPGLAAGSTLRRGATSGAGVGYGSTATTQTVTAGHDEGGEVAASRFFPQFPADEAALFGYHAKPSRAERDAGVSLDARPADAYATHRHRRMEGEPERFDGAPVGRSANDHPTVKSIALMRWLVRLVTRPGDVVLDPFGGSGTTGAAALAEGRRVILVERDPRFAEIARQRCAHASPDLGAPIRVPARAVAAPTGDARQLGLFDAGGAR